MWVAHCCPTGLSNISGLSCSRGLYLQNKSKHPAVCPQLQLEKSKGEILGVVIVESGWGSILPTVILANMMNGAPAARSGKLSIGDQIMSINNTSLVGLPLATCQGIIKVQRERGCAVCLQRALKIVFSNIFRWIPDIGWWCVSL